MLDQKALADILKAKQQVVTGKLTIWNERLKVLLESGKIDRLVDHLNSSLEDINNCGCNVQCGVSPDLATVTR